MKDIAKAQFAKSLGDDPTFREVIADIKQTQADVFLKANSSSEDIEEAHSIIRALDKIDGYIQSARNTLTVAQHNGNTAP